MIKGRKLDHIGVACSDVEKNAKWYQEVLGFTVKGKFPGDNGNVYFLENPADGTVYEMYQDNSIPADAVGKVDHIAYTSDSLEQDLEECKKQGLTILTRDIECCPTFWSVGTRYFKIGSPCGESIEFCQTP